MVLVCDCEAVAPHYRKSAAGPDVREAFTRQGAEVSGSTPEQLGAYVASELAKWAKVVAASGARID